MSGSFTRPTVVRAAIAVALLAGSMAVAAPADAVQTWIAGNDQTITVPDHGAASPYPSVAHVSGMGGTITHLEVSMIVSHTYPSDLDVMLVGPQGQNIILMSDVGGGNDVEDVVLFFSDRADATIPLVGPLVGGVYKPTNFGAIDTFPAPAPSPSSAAELAVFNGTNPNGPWSLYVVDGFVNDAGKIDGFSLIIETDGPDLFNPVAPARVFDTRPNTPQGTRTVNKAKVQAGQHLKVTMTGTAGVPAAGVGAVALNVTVNAPEADGYVTVYPCTQAVPNTSSVNFRRGQTVPNPVIAPVHGTTGEVCFYAARTAHLVVDVTGWFANSNLFHAVPPTRMIDSRPSQPHGSIPITKGKLQPNQVLEVTVWGQGGVPLGMAQAVALNVTVNGPEGDGFLTVYPCGEPPSTSSVNFRRGQTVANAVVTPLGENGKLCFRSAREAHLIVDISTWFHYPVAAFQGFNGSLATRLVDTRPSQPQGTVPVTKAKVAAGSSLRVKVVGSLGLPPFGMSAAVLNVTVNGPDGDGFVTAYPCGPLPPTSSVNFRRGQTVANAVIVPVDDAGEVCFFAARDTHLIVDLTGWFADGENPPPLPG